MDTLDPFRRVICLDFEFQAPPGERPKPLCLVARELRTGQWTRLWLAEGAPPTPPYGTGPDTLLVAYYASAELLCHLALGWPLPARTLDLYAEFRCRTSGRRVPCGKGLLGAMASLGLGGLDTIEKREMRALAQRGGPYHPAEQLALLDYCQSDVDAVSRLLPVMLPGLDLPRALLRGRYTAAVARMEWTGIPLDPEALARLRDGWDHIKWQLVAAVDRAYGVFVPTNHRPVNPNTRLGALILETARRWGLDPDRLAEAVELVWEQERAGTAELFEARRAARKATGLTHRRINQWEDAGGDHASYPDLDVTARSLAGTYPVLGLGPGYTSEGGVDDTDYSGRLWEILRDRDERGRPRHDPRILHRAAELVRSGPPDEGPQGPLRFSADRWATYLARKGISWPRLESGALALDDETFRERARAHPEEVGPIRELRHALSQMRLQKLAVGADGRHRCLLSPFASKTGRNQPSNTQFIFGPSVWLRSLIRPGPGRAVAYVDWAQQELGIAAALSGDATMQEAYTSGDFYMTFAQMAGAVPAWATKGTHSAEREQFKTVALGVLYGLSATGLARKLVHGRRNQTSIEGEG